MRSIKNRASLNVELLEDRLAPAVFWVINTNDNSIGGFNNKSMRNEGSLRWSVVQANADNARDEIRFDLPGFGPFAISLDKKLADLTITNPVDVLGNTQLAANGLPGVVIDGSGRGYGLVIRGTSATVKSLIVRNSATAQILLDNGNDSQILGSLIGIDSGNNVSGGSVGIKVLASSNARIGSATSRNVISGNDTNVLFERSSDSFVRGITPATMKITP